MIGKIVSFFALVVVAYAAVASNSHTWVQDRPMEGVDPNTVYCDPAGEVFLLLPHFTNCSKFFMCVHGNEVEMECAPGGLVFDFSMQTCNWAWDSPCELREPEGSGDEREFAIFGDEIENGPIGELTAESSGTVRPLTALSARETNNANALICDHPHTAARQVAYKGDCQRYWRCVAGVPQTSICTDGLFFNEGTMQCDHEANVRCTVEISDELNGEYMISK